MESCFQVANKQCDQCLFSKKKIVSDSRRREILAQVKETQSYFVCHKTEDVCCRGFYDSSRAAYSQLLRIAERLGAVRFVESEKIQ